MAVLSGNGLYLDPPLYEIPGVTGDTQITWGGAPGATPTPPTTGQIWPRGQGA